MERGEWMKVAEIIEKAIADKGLQKKDIAQKMGWSPQNFNNRLRNNTISSEEWIKLAALLGCEVKMVAQDGKCVTPYAKGIGGKVAKMVDGYSFNSEKADALCHSSKIHRGFFELYKTEEGFTFLVFYPEYEPVSSGALVMQISRKDAREFYKECGGQELEKVLPNEE